MYRLPNNTLLNQRYTILRSIGQGSFGIVYLVKDKQNGTQKAIKELFIRDFCIRNEHNAVVIEPNTSSQTECKEKFHNLEANMLEEYRVLSLIQDDHTLKVYEHFHANDTFYLVMEYIEADTLDDTFSHSILPWQQNEIVHLLKTLLQLLTPLHQQGYIHSDIKPSNIMVIKASNSDNRLHYRYRLVDYSNIKSFQSSTKRVHNFIGNEAFVPPEYKNERDFYASSDIYSLGMVAYSLLSHIQSPPSYIKREDTNVEAEFQKQMDAFKIENKYKKILAKMTALNPNERYQDLADLNQAIISKKSRIQPLTLLPFIAVVSIAMIFLFIQPKYFVKLDYIPQEANITIDNHPFDANATYIQGRHKIHIEATGYEPYDESIDLPHDKRKAIELKPIAREEANL